MSWPSACCPHSSRAHDGPGAMHRRKNNPSTVTKKPRASASGGIMATATSVAVVTTAAAIGGTNAGAVEGGGVATIAANAETGTAVSRDTVMVTDMGAIRDRVTFPSLRKACGFRSHLRRRRYTWW
jgi:hypothetical protein